MGTHLGSSALAKAASCLESSELEGLLSLVSAFQSGLRDQPEQKVVPSSVVTQMATLWSLISSGCFQNGFET